MENLGENAEFRNVAIKVLQLEYKLSLSKDISIGGIRNENIFDFGDRAKNSYVEFIENIINTGLEQIKKALEKKIKIFTTLKVSEKTTVFVVFNVTLSKENLAYLQNFLNGFSNISYHILDRSSILNLVKKYRIEQKNDYEIISITNQSKKNFPKENIIKEAKDKSGIHFWWLNSNPRNWDLAGLKPRSIIRFRSENLSGKPTAKVENLKIGDFLLLYQTSPLRRIIGILQVDKSIDADGYVSLKYVYQFPEPIPLDSIRNLFEKNKIERNLPGQSFLTLITREIFILIVTGKFSNQKTESISPNSSSPPTFEDTDNEQESEDSTSNSPDDDTVMPGEHFQAKQTRAVQTSNDLAQAKEDLLGFEPDVKVLASLMALKKLDPPFAIALFGTWGTGKSFFMYQLEQKIKELSEFQGFLEKTRNPNNKVSELEGEKYCKGIAQINFNAWSYIDSNLWAGLVSTIFEKLNEYITESTKSGVAKLKVQGKLGERLKAFRALKETEVEKKDRLEILKQGYKQESDKLEKKIIQNIGQAILEISEADSKLNNAYNGLFLDAEKFGENFTIQGTNLVSEYRYWTNFIQNIKKVPQLLKYVSFALLGIILAAFFVILYDWNLSVYLTIPVISILSKAVYWWNTQKRKIKRYVDQFNAFISANSEIKDKVSKLEEQIRFVDDQKQQAIEKINELDLEINNIQYDLSNDLTGAAIRDFINDRAGLKDYKKHLGIVSTIRKDFETLSELFLESNGEIDKTNNEGSINKSNKEILAEDRGFIKDQFKEGKKLERIILYIDDLDRCTDEKVLEVLQAVYLLMAFPLFIVVVGVDKRCVNNALNHKNILQYFNSTGVKSIIDLKEKFQIDIIHPDEYLEKIFQIPFQIPEANSIGVCKMIDNLFDGQIIEEESEEEKNGIKDFTDIGQVDFNQETSSMITTPFQLIEKSKVEVESIEEINEDETELVPVTPPDLTITRNELNQIKKLSGLVGNSPRTIKRFVNLYRILRAHSGLSNNTLSDNANLAIMFALAINIGQYKHQAEKLFKELNTKTDEQLAIILTESRYPDFYKELIRNEMGNVLDISCADINRHLPFIKRFSFGDILNNEVVKDLSEKWEKKESSIN